MEEKHKKEKNWKKVLIKCIEELSKEGILQEDIRFMTGKLILEINLNEGGITDLDVYIKRKFK